MQTATHLDMKRAESDGARPSRLLALARKSLPVGCAVGGACLAYLSIASAAYQTHATVEVADVGSLTQQAVIQSASKDVVSKPVIARAAASLIGTSIRVPEPGFVSRLAVAFDYGEAAGKTARLESLLAARVDTTPGDALGSIFVAAGAADPDEAAQIANAVADALIASQDEAVIEMRRKRAQAAAGRLKVLQAAAQSAHQRLAALDPVELDPAQARAAAAAQTTAAQNRLDTIKAIMASGSPPLSDRRDVPQSIETLQNVYLEVSKELAKARETLGDRHFTIVSLREGVQRAAQNLTAEWRRLSRLAEADVRAAKDREASLRKAETPAEIERRATFAAARNAAQAADDAVARAEAAQREILPEERPFRLVARAPVPREETGFSLPVRLLLALFAGALGWAAAIFVPKLRTKGRLSFVRHRGRTDQPKRVLSFFEEESDEEASPSAVPARETIATTPSAPLRSEESNDELIASLRAVVSTFDEIEPRFGALPTVMFAANETGQNTTAAALACAEAAADAGWRVFLIETERARPELAAAADAHGDPILADTFGALRVALPADSARRRIYLAPCLANGKRIASALARNPGTRYVEELAADFDLVIIDGGRAADAFAQGWQADAYVRVGRAVSARGEERLLAAVEASRDELIGTVTAAGFTPTVGETSTVQSDEVAVRHGRDTPPASYGRRSAQQTAIRPRAMRSESAGLRRRPG